MFQNHQHLTDFVPHKVCWLMRSDIIFTHAIGDGLIFISYFLIPAAILYLTQKYRFDWSLRVVFFSFSAFITLCGLTHLLDVIMIYKINEWLIVIDGWLRVVTGIVSLFTVGVTVWAIKIFLKLVENLFVAATKLTSERAKFGRATQTTVDEFNKVINEAKCYLSSREIHITEAN